MDSKMKNVVNKIGYSLSSKKTLVALLLTIVTAMSFLFSVDKLGMQSLAQSQDAVIGGSSGGVPVKFNASSGKVDGFVAAEVPVLMVSLDNQDGPYLDMTNGYESMITHYGNWLPTSGDMKTELAFLPDKAASNINVNNASTNVNLAWYVSGSDHVLMSSPTENGWYNSIFTKHNGAGDGNDPTGGVGVYRVKLNELKANGQLRDWRTLVNDNTKAQSKKLWGSFATTSGGSWDVSNKIRAYMQLQGLDLDNVASWSAEDSNKASIAYLDLLMTLYSCSTGTPENATEWEAAVDRYINNGFLPGQWKCNENIILYPGVAMQVGSSGDRMVMSCGDAWNYAYHINGEYSLGSKDVALNTYGKLGLSDVYQRLYESTTDNRDAYGNSTYFLNTGGFSYVINYSFAKKIKLSNWQLEAVANTRQFVQSLYMQAKDGTMYYGINIVPSIPMEITSESSKFNVDFDVIWSNKRGKHLVADSQTIDDIAQLRIKMKVPENEKATWETIFDKYTDFELAFDVKSNSDTGRLTRTTKSDNGRTSTLSKAEYQVDGQAYEAGSKVKIEKTRLKSLLWGEITYDSLYESTTKTQSINYAELQQFGYDLVVTIYYKNNTSQGASVSSELVGYTKDETDGQKAKHKVTAYREEDPNRKISYYSDPEAFAEIKEGTVHRDSNGSEETWEAMAGVPNTETLYFTSGGSEFIVELELEFVEGEKAERWYETTFFGTECEFKRGDQFKPIKASGTSSVSSFSNTPTILKEKFTTDLNGFDTGNIEEKEAQWYQGFKPEGSASATYDLQGHPDTGKKADGTSTVTGASYQKDNEPMSSTTITASWTGKIVNSKGTTSEQAPSSSHIGGYEEGNTAPEEHGGQEGHAGDFAESDTKWDDSKYIEALKQAEQWAKAYESTNATYTAKKLATGDQNTRIWKIGNATISVGFSGGNSNQGAGSRPAGAYSTAEVAKAYATQPTSPGYWGYNFSFSYGTDGTTGSHTEASPPDTPHSDTEGNPTVGSKVNGVGDITYTIKVTFDNGTYDAHELCGPCCQHNLPQIFDTWTQKSQYDYARINTMRVFKIHRSYVNDMEEITFVDYDNPEDLAHTSSGETLIQDLSKGVPWMHGALDKKTKVLSPAEQAKKHNGTDTIVAAISQGDPNIFYNIANESESYRDTSGSNRLASYPSMAGRLRYSFQAQRHDKPYIEEMTRRGNSGFVDNYKCEQGSRSNKCDGQMRTISGENPVKVVGKGHDLPQVSETAELFEGTVNKNCFSNGILYSHTDWTADQVWMETLTQAEVPSCESVLVPGTIETAGKGMKKQGYANNIIDDKDYLTEEYHRMRYRRNMLTDINVVSDMLILQTSTGDQPVMYYVAPKQTKRLQQHFDYNEADKADNPGGEFSGELLKNKFDNMWNDNPDCALNWGSNNIGQDGDINVGSYLGLGDKDPDDKFSDTGKHHLQFKTIFDNTGGLRVYGDMDTSIGHLLYDTDKGYSDFAKPHEFGANKMKSTDKFVGRQDGGFEASVPAIVPGGVSTWVVDNKIDEVDPRDTGEWNGIGDSYYISSPSMRYPDEVGAASTFFRACEKRKERVTGLRIFTDEIRQDPTNVNKEYITGEAKQTYHLIKDYDKSTNFAHEFNIEDIYAWDEDDGKIVDGFVLDAPYTRNDTKVNDIVVQNPVSVESAAIVHRREVDGGDFSYDTRADNELAGAQNLKDYIDGLDVCPGVPDLCDFRILNCSYDTDKVLFSTNFEFSNKIDGKEVETVYDKTGADGVKRTYIVNTTDSSFRYELPDGFTVTNDKIKYTDSSFNETTGVTTTTDRWLPIFNDTNNDVNDTRGNNNYLKCDGTRWSIPLSDLKLGKYSPNTKLAIEFDFFMKDYPDEDTMLVSFNNYDFYIPAGSNLGSWNTGVGIEKQVKNTSFVGGRMKLKLMFDFDDATNSEVYINNEKLKPEQYRIVNDSNEITEDMIGSYLNIGSWNINDEYGTGFYIDNLKITKIAGDRFHTDACYRELQQHQPSIQYTCQELKKFNYNSTSTGEPELYMIPTSGRYKVEAYGAQGGGTDNQVAGSHAGLGGYSYGFKHFDKGQQVLVYPGGMGSVCTSNSIPDDPVGFKEGVNTFEFSYSGNVQTFTAPVPGAYTFEVWGAQGGSDSKGGGLGGYAKGTYILKQGDTISIYVGGAGATGSGRGGGWNGGGNPGGYGSSGGGGGASDIRVNGTALANRVIVAGGGGGGGASSVGEPGGGTNSGNNGVLGVGSNHTYNNISQTGRCTCSHCGYWACPNYCGNHRYACNSSCTIRYPVYGSDGAGGGGGYYGGAARNGDEGGYGGSNYIGGVTEGSTQAGVRSGHGYAKISTPYVAKVKYPVNTSSGWNGGGTSDIGGYGGGGATDIRVLNYGGVYTLVNGMAESDDGRLTYGPYIAAGTGHYQVDIYGKDLNKCRFDAYTNDKADTVEYNPVYPINNLKATDTHVTFYFTLTDELQAGDKGLEVRVHHEGAFNYRFDKMYISRLEDRVVVGGGGGGADDAGGTLEGSNDGSGGYGGGLVAGNAHNDGKLTVPGVALVEDLQTQIDDIKDGNGAWNALDGVANSGCGLGGGQNYGYALGYGENVSFTADTGGAGGGYYGGYVTNSGNGGAGGGSGYADGLQKGVTTGDSNPGHGYATLQMIDHENSEGIGNKLVANFDYTGNVQEFTAQVAGNYYFETWGAAGGDGRQVNTTTIVPNSGGAGAYAAGTKFLNIGDTVYIYVGGKGESSSGAPLSKGTGGWNGGGTGGTELSNENLPESGAGGGGATDIRTSKGSLASRFIVAAGGGGAGDNFTEGLTDIENETVHKGVRGGEGGAEVGLSYNSFNKGGTQTGQTLGIGADGYSNNDDNHYGSYGGGGGGYYGGYWEIENDSDEAQGGAGGSSYTGQNVFDSVRVAGTGTMPNPKVKDTANMTGNHDNGYARIWLKDESTAGHTSECSFVNNLNNVHIHSRACISETNKALISALDAEWAGNHYLLKYMLGETLYNKLTNPESVYTIGGFTKTDYKQFEFKDCNVSDVAIGKLYINNFGANPHMTSEVNIPAGAVTKIIMSVELQDNPTTEGEVYWITDKDKNWGVANSVKATYDSDNKQYVFDVSSNSRWCDTVKAIRFDFVADNTPGGQAIVEYIDFIGSGSAKSSLESTTMIKSYVGFAEESHHGVADAGRSVTSFIDNKIQCSGNEEQLNGMEFKLPVSIVEMKNIKFIRIKAINLSNSTVFGVAYGENSEGYASVAMDAYSDAVQDIIIPVNWPEGNTDALWFDPMPNADKTGTIKIESIELYGYGTLTTDEKYIKEDRTVKYSYTGGVQSFEVPYNGLYTLEVYGGQGANDQGSNTSANRGGYAKGDVNLQAGKTIYVVVGAAGPTCGWTGTSSQYEAYNGGGRAGGQTGNGGGGATHIAITNRGVLSNYNSYRNEVLLVAGGGGGAGDNKYGGSGGGTNGGSGYGASGGTQTSGYSFGRGQNAGGDQCQGGGGGWYGGYGTYGMSGAGGGSGYIGGVTNGSMQNNVNGGHGQAIISYKIDVYTSATISGYTPTRLNVGYISSLAGLDGTQQGVINAINNIAQYIDEIPDPVGGEYNPIFSCDRLYNTHVCTDACNEVTKVLDCQEPHHYGMHYTKATSEHESCYEPCLDDSKHKKNNHQLIDVDGKHIEESIYINTDEYFSVFFPNVGDFFESNLHGIGSTTQTRGMSYIDQMKTSKWTREKYVKFNFDSLFYREETGLWEQYKAGSWIELPVKGQGYPYYNFYCTLNNPEIAAAHVEFASEGINAKESKGKYNYKNWQGLSTEDDDEVNADDWVYKNIDGKKTASNHRNNNDNPTEETNKERRSTLSSLHGAHRDTYVDLVGRIGNFAIIDSDDFRWCNMFKVPKNDGTWIVDGIIQEVIESEQNNYLSWHYNNGALAKDIRNRLVSKPKNMYDTWGTQAWKSGKDDAATALAGPLGSSDSIANNPEPLERDLMKPGYNVNFEITTTGNYQQYLQVKPYFYALCVKNDGIHTQGTMYPVDVHMNTEEGYKPINLFGAVDDTETWNKYKDDIYDYILSLNWDEEFIRRNYNATEQAVTENIAKVYTVQSGDGEAPIPVPSGRYYALGTAQIIRAEGNARTFIGSEHTVREEFNADTTDNTNFDDLFNKTDYEFKAQRWHLKLGVPSSAVFTFYDEDTGERHNALDEITWNNKKMKAYEPISESGNYIIVMTANIKALGETWNLYYSQADGDNDAEEVFYNNGIIRVNGKNYVFDDYIGPRTVNMDDVDMADLRKRVVDRTGKNINSAEIEVLAQKEYDKILEERLRAQNRVIIAVYDASNTSQVDVDIIGTH